MLEFMTEWCSTLGQTNIDPMDDIGFLIIMIMLIISAASILFMTKLGLDSLTKYLSKTKILFQSRLKNIKIISKTKGNKMAQDERVEEIKKAKIDYYNATREGEVEEELEKWNKLVKAFLDEIGENAPKHEYSIALNNCKPLTPLWHEIEKRMNAANNQ